MTAPPRWSSMYCTSASRGSVILALGGADHTVAVMELRRTSDERTPTVDLSASGRVLQVAHGNVVVPNTDYITEAWGVAVHPKAPIVATSADDLRFYNVGVNVA